MKNTVREGLKNIFLYALPLWCILTSPAIFGARKDNSSYTITGQLSHLPEPPAKDSATVMVKLSNPHNYPVYFPYNIGEKWFHDSSYTMADGYRVYKLPVRGSRVQRFFIRNPTMNIRTDEGSIPGPTPVILLKGGATITIEGDAGQPLFVRVKSSDKDVADYEIYRSKAKLIDAQRWEAIKKIYGDTAYKALKPALNAEIDSLDAALQAWQIAFVKEYVTSAAALEVFADYYYKLENSVALNAFAEFPEALRSSAPGKTIRSKLDAVARTSEAHPVISFKQKGVDGKMVDIDALKGKVVIIDFWGTWCGPCRETHPHLRELYKKYKGKGLEIVGVAYENGKKEIQEEMWRKAITEDGMTWLNVLNDPDKNDLVKLYGISLFPTKLLIDRKGNILLRHVGESAEALDEKLKELLP